MTQLRLGFVLTCAAVLAAAPVVASLLSAGTAEPAAIPAESALFDGGPASPPS